MMDAMLRRRDLLAMLPAACAAAKVPDKLVVLTLDDAVKSHRTFVAPFLKELGFRATFFVSHRWMEDREHFMNWSDIAEIHQMGFEIGNHTWTHADFSVPRNAARLAGELALVESELRKVKVPKPTLFAHTGNTFGPESIAVIRNAGIRLARRGLSPEVEYGKVAVGPTLDVTKHHPLLIPTTGDAYPDWTFDHFRNVVSHAHGGQIVVLQFHGVPDIAHPWVHTPPEAFRRYMEYLKKENFQVVALGDLAPYFDFEHPPQDPMLHTRYKEPKNGKLLLPVEMEASRKDEAYWIGNMSQHGYSAEEMARVLGHEAQPVKTTAEGLRILPYPGGRHPRIGFLDGAIDPMRGTKATVFLPWPDAGYVVVDVPEAIFSNLGLTFLAHTHIPTIWNNQNVVIENREWQRNADGSLASEWILPNKIAFGANLRVEGGAVRMELWLRNGTPQLLTGLRVQNCVMTKGAPGFRAQTNDNKTFRQPLAAVRSSDGRRWILTEWERCGRVWGNANCPCFHSDPVLPDCAPGETVRLNGRLWFHEGDLAGALNR
jgi:peptidoglycan/xylan/chitin deacetylase (PgdA/CDA1 family)